MIMPKTHAFKPESLPQRIGSSYPKPFNSVAPNRIKHILGDHAGLTQYGVNFVVLPPGEASALRHWHRHEDEFVYVLSGEVVLITNDGEELMTTGMCVGFPAGVENGHHLVNRSTTNARYLEIGTRADSEEAYYPDVDLHVVTRDGQDYFTNKKGESV
jgi:uncharacterized cupin superfamily protein